jgi:maltose O-acetyltransferase
MRRLGFTVGRGTTVSPRCFFGRPMIFGARCFINYECLFNTSAGITVGDDCFFGMRVVVATSAHEIGPSGRRAGSDRDLPVVIGDGCWIGANATILPGVTIGHGVVVAAGAVVIDDCAPDGLYGGVPARRLRDLPAGAAAVVA